MAVLFQSTHSLRSATATLESNAQGVTVSIHALLAECDRGSCSRGMNFCGFNPRTPCGVRPRKPTVLKTFFRFQSTHSLRSATPFDECNLSFFFSFNPRTPCGVRPWCWVVFKKSEQVSIHALLAECDGRFSVRLAVKIQFQSTHSLRSATVVGRNADARQVVSIHALLAECDAEPSCESYVIIGFNPRTPCGVRPWKQWNRNPGNRFQSTHSLRSATDPHHPSASQGQVSIHALLAECDRGSRPF